MTIIQNKKYCEDKNSSSKDYKRFDIFKKLIKSIMCNRQSIVSNKV